jgi:CDP-glucose 4,6-dehydratase
LDVTDGADTLRGRRVFVTGHTGFKGTWLSVWLRMLGAQVCGYALDPTSDPNMFDAVHASTDILDHRGDIGDARAVRALVEQFDPEVVFHLAAQSLVREAYRNPVETYATNVMGTVTLLEACRHAASVRAIIVVSSDKCYENRNWVWGYRENDRLGGFDPYSSSKACTEIVCDAFRRSFFDSDSKRVGLATARAGNVIGGGDWSRDRLIPDLARSAIDGRRAMIRNRTAVRPWQHVLEPLAGYLTLAHRLCADPQKYSGSWNFGPPVNSVHTVESVVNKLVARWDGRLEWSSDEGKHPHEALRLLLDSSKARSMLDWSSRLTFDEAIDLTADWYSAAREPANNLRALTEAQISAYSARASLC